MQGQQHTNGHSNGHPAAVTNGGNYSSHNKSASLLKPIKFKGGEEEVCINTRLPKELILHIFSFLTINTLYNCSQVCKYWYTIAFDGSNWKRINLFEYQKDVGPLVIEKIAQRCRGFLRELKLKGCQNITDEAIESFANHCRLIETLDLAECKKLTDLACQHLGTNCPNLRVLKLGSCQEITNNGLQAISKCSQLVELDVSWCKIDDYGLAEMASGCTQLERLYMQGCNRITSRGIRDIAKFCRNLIVLNLNYCGQNINDQALIHLGHECSNLRMLAVSNCAITDAGIHALAKGCPELRTLEMASCSHTTDNGFTLLSKACPHLEKLDLEDCGLITDTTLIQLGINCPLMNNLILSHCDQITDHGIERLVTGLCGADHLRSLAMDNCPLLTDAALEHLGANCTRLAYLGIFDCQLITRSGIKKLENTLVGLRIHAYFAPATPPGSTIERRRRYCRCCTIV